MAFIQDTEKNVKFIKFYPLTLFFYEVGKDRHCWISVAEHFDPAV
jgi:hypothetical protein